jgi:hypothetical protein
MAKLSAFKTDSKAIHEGEWIRVGEEYDDLDIRTRGFTDAYFDAQAAKQRKAAVGFGGDVSKLPSALRRQINIECLLAHVVLDVRNLQHDDGRNVTFEEFKEMLRDPDYGELLSACFKAASMVGQRRAADLEDAAGN